MDADTIVLVLTCMAAVTALTGLATGRAVRLWTVATVVLVGLALAVAWFYADPDGSPDSLVTVVAGLVAVTGGGLVTTQVFGLVDKGSPPRRTGEVLRGGAWIGALERLGVYVALVAGWGPGLAIVLAVKGLGRYPGAAQPGGLRGRRAVHHRDLHQRALGRGLCRPGRAHVVAARPGHPPAARAALSLGRLASKLAAALTAAAQPRLRRVCASSLDARMRGFRRPKRRIHS